MGRDPAQNTVLLQPPERYAFIVSRTHAFLQFEGEDLELTDRGSVSATPCALSSFILCLLTVFLPVVISSQLNGTFVNGVRIVPHTPTVLCIGDRV